MNETFLLFMIKIEIKIMEFYKMLKTHRNLNIDFTAPYSQASSASVL